MIDIFHKGGLVVTPNGLGTIVYVRMKAPNYSEPEAYSVLLYIKHLGSEQPPLPTYTGTIFSAEQVSRC